MPQFVPGTSKVAANRRKMLDPTKALDKVRDISDDDVVAILGHRTPGAAYSSVHPPLAEMGEPEDPMRELVKPTDGAAAGDRIRCIQFTDSMYFAPMVPYVRSWMASTRFRGVDPGTQSGRQIIEARERDLDKMSKILLESEAFDAARSGVRGCTVHGHSLRLDRDGMMFDLLARSVMNPDGSVSIVKDQLGRPLDKAVPVGKPKSDAELKSRTTTYRVDGDAVRADKELITYIQRMHTLRTMWGFKPMSDDELKKRMPRSIRGDLFKLIEGITLSETRGLMVGQDYRLDIFIGPSEGTITADEIFDEKKLDWKKKQFYTLQVMFAEPEQWEEPLTGKLFLPREGASSKCKLLFKPTRSGPFSGRVTIYHRGRILQTALLRSTVFDSEAALAAVRDPEPLSFKVEAVIRHSFGALDERRRFDVCVVLNKTTAGKSVATVASENGAYIRSLDNVKRYFDTINSAMNDVANEAHRYSKGLLSDDNKTLLRKLAVAGSWIYRYFVEDELYRSAVAEDLRKAQHVQIVSARPDVPVPLEFVYDFPPPQPGAAVCELALDALKKGKESVCPRDCKPKATDGVPCICPLGFWGLSRVIERHQSNSMPFDIPAEAIVSANEPVGGRDILSLKGPSLIAASEQVPDADRTLLERSIKAVWNHEVVIVKKWNEWLEAVKKKPVMLLALPHTSGSGTDIKMEISGDIFESALIDERYVKMNSEDIGPLVILFGCDTANVANIESYTSHVTVFRQAKAPLVLGTVGTVLGKDAAKVAAKIVEHLVAASENSTERFGEVFRQVKREAVAESLMVALCLVAFGDADWRLQ